MRRIIALLGLATAAAGPAAAAAAAPTAAPAPTPVAAPTAAQVASGRRLFARCVGCHQVGPNAVNVFGPQLNGIIGRRAGSAAGYAYSPALKKSTLVWNQQNLVAFIGDSDKVIPGNKMRFFSFLNDRQLADIVAYLGTQAPQPAAARRPASPGTAR